MLIDIIVIFALILAIFKGLSKGFILALFSIIAYIIGIAAALKLSAVVASSLEKNLSLSTKWLPLISFFIVFLIVVLLVRLGAKLVEKTFQVAMLGWSNRLGGAVFYSALYIIILSVFLFFAEAMRLIKPETIAASQTYTYIQPWGPWVINNLGKIIPLFNDVFSDLQEFFGKLAQKAD